MARDKDTLTKAYMENAAVFADIFNFLIYDGEQVIDPAQLRAIDTTTIALPYNADGESAPVQKYRDLLKHAVAKEDGETAYLLLGIESQSEVHYAMPVRNMLYDALQYEQQIRQAARAHRKNADNRAASRGEYLSGFYKEDRLLPVVTLVVYFGATAWDGPHTLHEMLSTQNPRILRYVPDYSLNLLEPAALTEEQADSFRTDMREVMLYVKYSRNRDKLRQLVEENQRFQHMERITAEMLRAVTGSRITIHENEEVVNMCKALEDMCTDARQEGLLAGRQEGLLAGRQEGILTGRLEGVMQQAKQSVLTMKSLALPEDMIAQIAHVSIEQVRQWLAEPAV